MGSPGVLVGVFVGRGVGSALGGSSVKLRSRTLNRPSRVSGFARTNTAVSWAWTPPPTEGGMEGYRLAQEAGVGGLYLELLVGPVLNQGFGPVPGGSVRAGDVGLVAV